MRKKKYKLKSKVVMWPGEAAWYFAGVDKKSTEQIKEDFKGLRRGFGSLRVEVKLGKTVWQTSIFPDNRSGMYLLPIKAAVREKEGIFADDEVEFSITLLVY